MKRKNIQEVMSFVRNVVGEPDPEARKQLMQSIQAFLKHQVQEPAELFDRLVHLDEIVRIGNTLQDTALQGGAITADERDAFRKGVMFALEWVKQETAAGSYADHETKAYRAAMPDHAPEHVIKAMVSSGARRDWAPDIYRSVVESLRAGQVSP